MSVTCSYSLILLCDIVTCGYDMQLEFAFHVAVHRDKFVIIEPTSCTNFPIFFYFGMKLHVSESSSVHHQEFFTVHTQYEQDQDVPS